MNQTKVCLVLPPKVNSLGLWKGISNEEYGWFNYTLPKLELHIGLIFAITQIFHFALKPLGLPLITSQLIAGLILSPAIIGQQYSENLFSDDSIQVLSTIGAFGYVFFLFLMGVKTDPCMITRVNKREFFVGFLSVIAPLICTAAILMTFSENQKEEIITSIIAQGYTSTSFPVIIFLLIELKIINSELGRTVLSAALVGEFLSLLNITANKLMIMTIVLDYEHALYFLGYIIAFLVVVLLMLRPLMLLVVRYTPEGKRVNQTFIYVIVLFFLFSTHLIKYTDHFTVLGPYILGLAVPPGPPLGTDLVEKFDTMVLQFFVPLLVSTSAMRVQSFQIEFRDNITKMHAMIAALASVVKFVVCLLPPFYYKDMPKEDAFALALIMNSKGVIHLAAFSYKYDALIIGEDVFDLAFIIIFVLATIVPVLVKRLYDPSRKYASYEKRTIMDSKPNAELQIVACIHVPDNVRAVINLLDVSCPSQDNPLAVNVLHLIKLRGQATPIFISHQKRKKGIHTFAYSENIILSFNKFEANYWGGVNVNTFTAVSPPSLMHDDICTLAMDKLASVIILPFHRRWFIDGSIESDDENLRTLNSRVLERAPCSVGILIDRGNIRRHKHNASSEEKLYRVCIIFLGGSDDREALTYAKRMAQDHKVHLTVAHLTAAASSEDSEKWDRMLDSVLLREAKTSEHINYMEKKVADGPETAVVVHSLINQYSLIIVGRRDSYVSIQTAGLEQWSEFPELGILGDLLASKDYSGKCSVLVVQQQKTTTTEKKRLSEGAKV